MRSIIEKIAYLLLRLLPKKSDADNINGTNLNL
jgi:hypothetical protein